MDGNKHNLNVSLLFESDMIISEGKVKATILNNKRYDYYDYEKKVIIMKKKFINCIIIQEYLNEYKVLIGLKNMYLTK